MYLLVFSTLSTNDFYNLNWEFNKPSALFKANPGIYLTSGSNFSATAGTKFPTIHAWIANGISTNSLVVYEGIPGSYVASDSFAVDYNVDTCQVLKSQYPPLQLTLRLAGYNPTTLGSLVGEHVIVVNGSNAGVSYLSPPIHLYGVF